MAQKMDLIDRNALMAKLRRMPIFEKTDFDKKMLYVEKSIIEQMPAVDAVEVVHGRWEHDSIGFSDFWVCSACREAWFFEEDPVNESTRVNYCPNCGAKMDGEREDE